MLGKLALSDRANHRLFSRIQMVAECQGRIQIAAANQGAEDRHMFVYGDNVALLEVALIPLVMEVENDGDYLK
jgi:hypothetical protein